MTNSVVIPIRIALVSGVYTHEVTHAEIVYGANGVNVAVLSVAVGRNEYSNGDPRDIASLGLQRGQEVRIEVSHAEPTSTSNPGGLIDVNANNYLYLTSGQFVLFRGLVDDFGPGNLAYGQFVLEVRVVSRLAWLAQGTLSSSNVLAGSFWDTTGQFFWGAGPKDAVLLDSQVASVNLWTGMQQALRRVATYQMPADAPQNTVVAAIQAVFGTTANTQASAILQSITGQYMTWNHRRTQAERDATIFCINQQLQSEWKFEPFLNRIFSMGENLKFAVIETGLGIQVVPYVPFFKAQSAYIISPNTYSSIRQRLAPYKNFAGVILVDGGGGRDPKGATTGASPLGLYKMPGTPFGQVFVTQLPSYLGVLAKDMVTGGKGVRSFSAGEAQASVNNPTSLANLFAKYSCWDLNYHERTIDVVCPFFRTDIGPLTAVRVDFPATEEIANILETPAVYGSVQSVTLSVDASTAFMQTTYSIGYVRSYSQQKHQIDPGIESTNEHPFFATNYIGGRLDTLQRRTPSAA